MSLKPITELFVWVSEWPDGDGMLAIEHRGEFHQLIGADRERVESWRPAALAAGIRDHRAVKLLRFSTLEVIERIEP